MINGFIIGSPEEDLGKYRAGEDSGRSLAGDGRLTENTWIQSENHQR